MNYERLPEHMREAARAYVEERKPTGTFLWAVLCNNLVDAFGTADDINMAAMRDWAMWLYNDAPRECWGSREAVANWLHPSPPDPSE